MSTSSDANGPPFVVVDGDLGSRVVIHVPHASTIVPDWVRQRIELSDEDLASRIPGAPWSDGTVGGIMAANADHGRMHFGWASEDPVHTAGD